MQRLRLGGGMQEGRRARPNRTDAAASAGSGGSASSACAGGAPGEPSGMCGSSSSTVWPRALGYCSVTMTGSLSAAAACSCRRAEAEKGGAGLCRDRYRRDRPGRQRLAQCRPMRSSPPHHALAGVDDSREAGDDGAEALLHVAHQQRRLRGRQPADAARRRCRRARGHGAHCTGQPARAGGQAISVMAVCRGSAS